MFAGLRREEIARLDWRSIDLDRTLYRSRSGEVQDCPAQASDDLGQSPRVARPFSSDLRASDATCNHLSPEILASVAGCQNRDWPNNALRHSFASYHLAAHQDAAKTALQLGHIESRTLFAHYRELVKPEDAKAFWKIFPSN